MVIFNNQFMIKEYKQLITNLMKQIIKIKLYLKDNKYMMIFRLNSNHKYQKSNKT